MGRSYSKLEGRQVVVDCHMGKVPCTVTGADYSLGITVQRTSDKTYMICLNGPKSPVVKGIKFNHAFHRAQMQFVYDTIMAKQVLAVNDLTAIARKTAGSAGSRASAKTCAFSQ